MKAAAQKTSAAPKIEKPLSTNMVWHISDDATQMPRLARIPAEHLHDTARADLDKGYWVGYDGPVNATAQAMEGLATFLCHTVGGKAEREEDWRKVNSLTRGFCEAFSLIAVPQEKLPRPLDAVRRVVFLVPK